MSTPLSTARRQHLSQERKVMYDKLQPALENEADPLAEYDHLVKWTMQNYVNHLESGLLELLEECANQFKDDICYKADLRYVKLWILFANHVDRPVLIYEYMMEQGIGKPYALFFEEYAEALEREGRFTEVETVIMLGIKTQARPLKHLRCFQDDYHSRREAGRPLPIKVSPFREGTCSANLIAIRTDPLRNIAPRRRGLARPSTTTSVLFTGEHDVSVTTTQTATPPAVSTRPNPYAHLSAPPAPGKRPEKLMFDLTLLLGPDGTEYCFAEARARHLGLLGKRWPPPPPPNAASSASRVAASDSGIMVREETVAVDFNDHGKKSARPARRQSVTVTINTKQALEDVLHMYNSQEKPDFHQAVRDESLKIETPAPTSLPSLCHDENASVGARKPRAFQPFSDQRRENITPAPLKFKPSTNKTPRSNAFTPTVARKALVTKELVTPVPVPAFKVVRPQQNVSTPAIHELEPPVEAREELKETEVFGGDDVTAEITEEFTHPLPPPPPLRSFVPFVDDESSGNAPLPPAPRCENAQPLSTSTTKFPKFQVHRDENPSQPFAVRRPIIGERTPTQSFFKPLLQEGLTSSEDDDASQAADLEDEYQEAEDRRFARSDRFANFDVMTPITERTYEFTTSTRAIDTPGSDQKFVPNKGFVALDAQDVAEKLAAELQEEEARDLANRMDEDSAAASPVAFVDPENIDVARVDDSWPNGADSSFEQPQAPFYVSDGFNTESIHSGSLSFATIADSTHINITEASASQPTCDLSVPCNPSDPDIISSILSSLPVDPDHRNLRHRIANNLNIMQRFVEKRSRRGSASSTGGRGSDGSDKLGVDLDGDRFEVFEKLGEGGFGAVFMAKHLNNETQGVVKEEYEDEDEGEVDVGDLVAVKAVRPTNLWEFYMLRRIIAAVPEDLRRSIIHPHRLYAFKDESFLVLDLCQQGTLLEIVNRANEERIGQPGGGLDELLVMFFTVELLRVLQGLHDHGFIHGDLKIDNCLIRLEDVPGGPSAWSSDYSPSGQDGWASKGIKLIDFGRTIDTNLFPPGQTFVADWKTDGRDCIEMREGRPWTFQTDYSGLASIVYCMLFGKYIETVKVFSPEGIRKVKPSQSMKRYWQVNLWERLFDTLLNPSQVRPDGTLPITDELVTLRMELETWIQGNCNKGAKNLKGMLKKIQIGSIDRSRK